MTEETIKEIEEIITTFTCIDLITAILSVFCLVGLIIFIIWEKKKLNKVKEMHNEWKSTLTNEQQETLKRNREYLK